MESAGVSPSPAGAATATEAVRGEARVNAMRTLYTEADEYLELIWQQKSRGRP